MNFIRHATIYPFLRPFLPSFFASFLSFFLFLFSFFFFHSLSFVPPPPLQFLVSRLGHSFLSHRSLFIPFSSYLFSPSPSLLFYFSSISLCLLPFRALSPPPPTPRWSVTSSPSFCVCYLSRVATIHQAKWVIGWFPICRLARPLRYFMRPRIISTLFSPLFFLFFLFFFTRWHRREWLVDKIIWEYLRNLRESTMDG